MRGKIGLMTAVAAVVLFGSAMASAWVRRFALTAATVAVLLSANSAVAAASSWSIQRIPNPTSARMSRLFGVSCASKSACTAVGFYEKGTKSLTLAERWNGTKWSIQPTPNPTGAQRSSLNSVSCASAGACTAVGTYKWGATNATLAERWNGTRWSIQPTPAPTGASNSYLFAVSCATPSACSAVGEHYHNFFLPRPLAERWNGTRWSTQPIFNALGASSGYLDGVACTSKRTCTAVGTYNSGTANVTLAERWNGSTWSVQNTPASATYSVLLGDSCTSKPACSAVGSGAPEELMAPRSCPQQPPCPKACQ